MKRFLSLLLAALLCLGFLHGAAPRTTAAEDAPDQPQAVLNAADDAQTTPSATIPLSSANDADLPSNDDLLTEYLRQIIADADPQMEHAEPARGLPDLGNLNEAERAYEKAFKLRMVEIAEGTRTSTSVTIPFSELGYSPDSVSFDNVFYTLLRDCSYEMYWSDRTYDGGYDSTSLTLNFYVAGAFAGEDSLTVDPAKVQTAQYAVRKAYSIVSDNLSLSDLGKLYAYRNAICELTDYHDDAASDTASYVNRGEWNPWQLIWVFDDDPETKVVCEGYSKAFQLLCDLSHFSGDVNCYCVSGEVQWSNGGGGAHMWNIVSMRRNNNYLVDVTNCDGRSDVNVRFLKHTVLGTVNGGFTIDTGDLYSYDAITRTVFSFNALNLSKEAYTGDQTPYLALDAANIPDPYFLNWMIDHLEPNYDAENGYYLTEQQVLSVTSIDCSSSSIQSLQGIGFFKSLCVLDCSNNDLTELDLDENPMLYKLTCSRNDLTQMNLSNNGELTYLICNVNEPLTSLNVSYNPKLYQFDCRFCQLSALDVGSNPALTYFHCTGNHLPYLNLGGLTASADNLKPGTQVLEDQTGKLDGGEYAFDLFALIPAQFLANVSLPDDSPYTYDPATGVVTFGNAAASQFTYLYATGKDDVSMSVQVNLTDYQTIDYYLIGRMTEWGVNPLNTNYPLLKDPSAPGTYILENMPLTAEDEFKVVRPDGDSMIWYPDGPNTNCSVAEDGLYTIHFCPSGGVAGWHEGCLFAEKTGELPAETGYYLVGNMTDWQIDPAYQLAKTDCTDAVEYAVDLKLTPDSELKIVYSIDGTAPTLWFPVFTPNYGENGEITETAVYRVRFRPNRDGGSGWFYECIHAENIHPYYEIVFDPGTGSGEPFRITSADAGVWAADWRSAQEGQFFTYGDHDEFHVPECPDTFTKAGFVFSEWHVQETDERWSAGEYKNACSCTVVAQWTPLYTISYVPIDPFIGSWKTTNPTSAIEGEKIDFTILLNDDAITAGYRLQKLLLTSGDTTITITEDVDGNAFGENFPIRTFHSVDTYYRAYEVLLRMPAKNITITAVWAICNAYYLVGNINGWSIDLDYRLTQTGEDAYLLDDVRLPKMSEFKIAYTTDGVNKATWYPDPGDNRTVDQNGVYTVTFHPSTGAYEVVLKEAIDSELAGFYLIGTMSHWQFQPAYRLIEIEYQPGFYGLTLSLSKGDEIKAIYTMDGAAPFIWYPDEENATVNYSVTYNVWFRPDYQGGNDNWFHGCLLFSPEITMPNFYSQSLTLDDGRIGVNFYMSLDRLSNEIRAASYMEFSVDGKGAFTCTDPFDETCKNASGDLYGFTVFLNSIQMADTITATYHYAEDSTVVKTYRVMDYFTGYKKTLESHPNAFTPAEQNLIEAVANYGHYVQGFLAAENGWSLGKDHAAMNALYDEQTVSETAQTLLTAVQTQNDTTLPACLRSPANAYFSKITYSLVLDAATAINVYLAPTAGSPYVDTKPNVTVTSGGDAVACTVERSGTRWCVQIPGIHAQNLDETFTIQVVDGNAVHATVQVSALCYVRSMLLETLKDPFPHAATAAQWQNAAAAIYNYHRFAAEYLASLQP